MKSLLDATFHMLVASYALLLILGSAMPGQIISGPSAPQYQVTELERRVGSIEALNLDHRLTVIETILQDLQNNGTWNRLTMGGTGLLIAERIVNVIRTRKDAPDDK